MTADFDAFNRFERSVWEQRADAYAKCFERLTTLTIEPLLDAARVRAGTALLDVGTGPGFVAAAAAARGAIVTGIDVAGAMVDLARNRVPQGRFEVGSAEDLPSPDAGFDAVVGNFVLLHLGYPERGAAEARRVLRAGGRVGFSLWDSPEANRAFGVVADAIARVGVAPPADIPLGPPAFRTGEAGAVAGLLCDAGFESVTTVACTGTVRVDPADWWEAVLRSTPRTGTLIAQQTAEVQAEIRACYDGLVGPHADRGEVVLPVAAVLASAVAPSA